MNDRTTKSRHKDDYIGLGDLFRIRKGLKLIHKVLYIAGVFIGLNLCWYGVWTMIGDTPILNIPLVAVVSGVVLLLITGKIKALL